MRGGPEPGLRGVENLAGDDPDAIHLPDRSQASGIREGSGDRGRASAFSAHRWKTRHLDGAYPDGVDGLPWGSRRVIGRIAYRAGGVVKDNVRILVALAIAVVLFFLVRHWFPQGAPR